ncbi:MAG: tyrosine--tRNA ligase [Holosporales bacterium]|jgi:tyrosyl-tRNA synthetase|nr:tyrosine--tRNA ligase [Holosporales bacterium]
MGFNFNNKILRDLYDRGFLYQFTNVEAIDQLFSSGAPFTFYIGFDATAKSLHVGHLLWIMLVNKLQKFGAKPIVLVGGATSKIGDPTWKSKERSMLSDSSIQENIDSIMVKLSQFIDFNNGKLVNNNDWLAKINYMDFLKNYGRYFSVNKMLSMDSVSERLKRQQHLSFLEFNYMLLQAYDFLHLYNTENCIIQLGGADQWSNIIFGTELIKKVNGANAYGMTIPLLTTSVGEKMGKTGTETIWLSENMTPPRDFWQYWRNIDDADVCKLLKLFTSLDLEEINKYESLIGNEGINEAKIKLADSITSFVHPNSDNKSIPSFEFLKNSPLDKIVFETGLAGSMTIARRLIESDAIRINDTVVNSIKHKISESCTICCGKKKFVNIKIL